MGYRSDVLIAVAFSSVEHRDEVWSVYCIDPRVQKNRLAGEWKNYDDGPYPALYYEDHDVKWYDNYEDVQGVEYMMDLASEFCQERGKPYAYVFIRVGEETTDLETVERHGGDNEGHMQNMLWELCGVERRITHNFN